MTWPLFVASILCVVAWLALTRLYVLASRQVRPLAEVLGEAPAAGVPAALPGLSIVVTARDEARDIETTVRHALAQSWPALERSEERRVGRECRARGWADDARK